jgi:hypothetical protein
MGTLLLYAQHICQSRQGSADESYSAERKAITNAEVEGGVAELCKSVVLHHSFGRPSHCAQLHSSRSIVTNFLGTSNEATEGEVDESSLCFRRELLGAAAWMGVQDLATQLVKGGCNSFQAP